MRTLSTLACLVTTLTATSLLAAVAGDPKDLVPSAYTSDATAINASGVAIGFFTTTEKGDVRKAFKGGSALPTFGSTSVSASGINSAGTVVGQFFPDNGPSKAFRGTTVLETVGDSGNGANDINDSNIVVGSGAVVNGNSSFETAVAWDAAGKGKLIGGGRIGRASAINKSGVIVGIVDNFPARWASIDASPARLPLPPGARQFGEAKDVNDSGVAVGYVQEGDGTHALLWQNGGVTDLGKGVANAINNNGEIAGEFGGIAGVRKPDGTVVDINAALPHGSKWGLGIPADINDGGQIVGTGQNGNIAGGRGNRRAYLFKPAGVGGPGGGGGGGGDATVQGLFLYEKVGVSATKGLQLSKKTKTAGGGVLVEAVLKSNDSILASTFTDNSGKYTLSVPVPSPAGPIYVRIKAQLQNGTLVEHETTDDLYAVVSSPFTVQPNHTTTKNLLAQDKDRGSGPFNILAAMRKADDFAHSADSSLVIPAISVRWAVDYHDGTFFRTSATTAFINGDRVVDSDEFDDTVIDHEYGHFYLAMFSKADTPGGTHSDTIKEDPRLAWNEGWATFFSCASNKTSVYVDTKGAGRHMLVDDLEKNALDTNITGFWSEHTVGSVLWDLLDTHNDPGDTVAVPWPKIWGATVDLKQDTFVYLIDFCERMHLRDPSLDAAMQSILDDRSILYSPGTVPPVNHPFPTPIPAETAISDRADSVSTQLTNTFDSSKFYEFTIPTARTVSFDLVTTAAPVSGSPADLDLYLLDKDGNQVGNLFATKRTGVGDTEHLDAPNLAAGTYVIEVRSWSKVGGVVTFNAGDFNISAHY